jgi:hypothetical protein
MTIQEALDSCLEDISLGNASIDECLARYPQYASELRPLLKTAKRLGSMNEVRPSRAFKSRLRGQLTGDVDKPRNRLRSLRGLLAWLLIILLIVIAAAWAGISLQIAGSSSGPHPLNYQMADENFKV